MNACMVAYTFYEGDNRVRRYAETLARTGWNVDIIALHKVGTPAFEVINGVNVYKIQKRPFNEKTKLNYLSRLVRFFFASSIYLLIKHIKHKYDIIHVHSVPDFQVFCAIIPKLLGSKIILDIHDLVPELFTSKFQSDKSDFTFRLLAFIEKISCIFSDHVIIANDIWRERLVKRSVAPRRCTTILNYPDEKIIKKGPVEKNKDTFLLVYPGTLSKHQGIETAIRAVDLLKSEIPNIRFSIYGKGTDEDYFKQVVSDLNLDHYVQFHSGVRFDLIASVMQKADIGVEPKHSNGFSDEAFSTKIFEFMMLSVPLVASDTTVHKYYINDSLVLFHKAGDHHDLADKIQTLYKDKKLRDQLVKNADLFIQKFTWEANKHLYFDMLNSLTAKKQ